MPSLNRRWSSVGGAFHSTTCVTFWEYLAYVSQLGIVMGRISLIHKMDEQQRAAVDRCIREHRYMGLSDIASALADQGIVIPRSNLHRHLSGLRAKDTLFASPDEGTIVTIVERSTGEVRVLKTIASGKTIAAMMEKIQSNAAFC